LTLAWFRCDAHPRGDNLGFPRKAIPLVDN
jgi:hypothetical protein